ncbi:MAG TPA: hypothetical protein VF307_04740 [Candidatus Nanopelagicaceae bacterium]
MKRQLLTWLLLTFLLALSILTSYFFVQQEGRSAINLPLIQSVQVVKESLASGVTAKQVLAGREIDLSINQNPFITLYSMDKKVIGSNSHYKGATLLIPRGILDRSAREGEVRVTWQPTRELRFASVTEFVPGLGYICVAQSLKEVENLATANLWRALAIWLFGTAALGLGLVLIVRLSKRT